MKKIYWFLSVTCLAIVIRIVTWVSVPGYWLTADTYTYLETAKNISRTGILVDPWRPPVFPLVFNGLFALSGRNIQQASYYSYAPEFVTFRFLQTAAGVVTIALLFYFLTRAGMPLWLTVGSSVIVAVNPVLLGFERTILTETFSLTVILCQLVLAQSLMIRYRVGRVLAFAAVGILGVLLRPATILLPGVLLAVVMWNKRTKIVTSGCIMGMTIYMITVVTYAFANYRVNGYLGISRISDINIFGKVLELNLPVGTMSDTEGIRSAITKYRQTTTSPDPWEFLREYPVFNTPQLLTKLASFSRWVIVSDFPLYILGVFRQSASALTESSDRVVHVLQYFYFTSVVGIFLVFHQKKEWSMMLVAATCLYVFAVTVFLTYGDYGRHLVVISPLMTFFSLWSVWQLAKKL